MYSRSKFCPQKTPIVENAVEKGGLQKRFRTWVKGFKNASFWKWSVSIRSVDRWNRSLLKSVTKKMSYAFASISVFGCFSVDNRRKRNKKSPFSYENASVWTGENKTKTLLWVKIFCFSLVEKETDTFNNSPVWSEPAEIICSLLRLRKPPSQLPFTAEMLVTTQTEAAAASPRSDSTLSAPHSTQNSPKPARYEPATNHFDLIVNFVLRDHTSYISTYSFIHHFRFLK